MLLRHYIRRVVRQSRPIRPTERPLVVAFWRVGFRAKAAATALRQLTTSPK